VRRRESIQDIAFAQKHDGSVRKPLEGFQPHVDLVRRLCQSAEVQHDLCVQATDATQRFGFPGVVAGERHRPREPGCEEHRCSAQAEEVGRSQDREGNDRAGNDPDRTTQQRTSAQKHEPRCDAVDHPRRKCSRVREWTKVDIAREHASGGPAPEGTEQTEVGGTRQWHRDCQDGKRRHLTTVTGRRVADQQKCKRRRRKSTSDGDVQVCHFHQGAHPGLSVLQPQVQQE
jgi:hypothetical protein